MRIAFAVATLLLASPAPAQDEFAPVRELIQTCVACHGENGAATLPENPILAGQQFYYLYLQLKDFKSGARASEIMAPIVQPLQPDQMKLLAQFFSIESVIEPVADAWYAPIETVSNSEAGFERVYQGSALLLSWQVRLEPGALFTATIQHRATVAVDLGAQESVSPRPARHGLTR